MARIANQMKGALSLACSVATSVAFGIASRRFDQPAGRWVLPACIGGLGFIVQLLLVFAKSKEETELEEFKRIQSAENARNLAEIHNQTRAANAITEQVIKAVESGNLDEAERWSNLHGDFHGR